MMEERTIEVNVVSARDLKYVKTFGGQQTSYVVAYIFPQTKRSTKVDTKGELNPTWNSTLTFICDERILERGGAHLTLEIYSQGVISDKIIGTVTIPLHLPVSSDGRARKSDDTPIDYSVRRPSGKTKGFLKVGVKIGEKRTIAKYAGTRPSVAYAQEPKKQQQQSYPPASFSQEYKQQPYPVASLGGSGHQFYPGSYLTQTPAAPSAYPPPAISPYSNSQGSVYPPPAPTPERFPTLTGYSTANGTTGVNVAVPPTPYESTSSDSSGTSSEPVTAYPAMGYPVAGGYSQYTQQYPPQGYPPLGYPSQYSSQPDYYPSGQQPSYYSKPPKHSTGSSGLGTGLLAGALGGLLLGDILDF